MSIARIDSFARLSYKPTLGVFRIIRIVVCISDFANCHADRLSAQFCSLLQKLGRCVQPSLAIQCCVTCKTYLSVRQDDKISWTVSDFVLNFVSFLFLLFINFFLSKYRLPCSIQHIQLRLPWVQQDYRNGYAVRRLSRAYSCVNIPISVRNLGMININ